MSVTNLTIDWFDTNRDYTFRDGYTSITINKISSNDNNNVVSFPELATNIRYLDNTCNVVLSPNVETLKLPMISSGSYSALRSLSCAFLLYNQPLPPTLEYLHVIMFMNDGSVFHSHSDLKQVVDRNYGNIFSLRRLNSLVMSLPCIVVEFIPKNIKILSVTLEYYGNSTICMKNLSVFDLTITVTALYMSIELPNTLTRFRCDQFDVDRIQQELPNLTHLHISTSHQRVATYDFRDHPLVELCTARSVLLSNLPETMLRLEGNSVLGEADDDFPQYLQSLKMKVCHRDQLEYLKSKLIHCTIECATVLDPSTEKLTNYLNDVGLTHITSNKIR